MHWSILSFPLCVPYFKTYSTILTHICIITKNLEKSLKFSATWEKKRKKEKKIKNKEKVSQLATRLTTAQRWLFTIEANISTIN
jgi:uncharacterized protein YqhQ